MKNKKRDSQSAFVTIATYLKLIGQPIFRLLLFTLPAILSFFHVVGKLTILIIIYTLRSIDKLVSQTKQTTQSIFQKTKLLNRNIVKLTKTTTRKVKFLFSHITFPKFPKAPKLPRFSLPKPSLRFLLTKKFWLFAFFTSLLSFFTFHFYFLILKDLPSPNQLITRQPILTTKIYDRNGRLLYKIYRRQNRSLVKLEDIPLYMKEATIAIEDKNFYHHQGLSLTGIGRALYRNLLSGARTGGSTITQQLVKNALLTPEKTWQRKTKEIILSVLVEIKFSKDEILQMYLNEVPYGSVAYGIEEAAQNYFNKHVDELDLAEATLLAGLPAAPTNYSPFGAHPELAKIRQKQVLEAMVAEGYITPNHLSIASSQNLIFALQRNEIHAPHFVMYVKDLLVGKYGQAVVENGGLEVITSLDLDIQEMAQQVVAENIDSLNSLKISNGAALVTNPKTGEILAMIGSKDYFNTQINNSSAPFQGNFNVTLAERQPGSSIKPINYAVALQNGFTPASVISDTPITYKIPGQKPYSPKNYDNRFHGNVSLRTALASSYNVPAVKVLAAMGVERMIDQAERMGITTWEDRSRFGLSLTLGGGEVKMIDMAVAYGVLANSGIKTNLNPILEVKNYQGKMLEKTLLSPQNPQALPPAIAYILTDILADNRARTPAFGPNSLLNIPNHKVAVKTGTTNNLRDNWAIGFTPSILVAAWVGNNDNTSMSYVTSGITGATPIWHNIMNNLLKEQANEEFAQPENLKQIVICGLTNTLTCTACPNPRAEFFLSGNEPKYACNEEMIKKILEPKEKITPTPQIGP